MKIEKTLRGFDVATFRDANGEECSLQASSAIGDYDDAFDRPGSSFVWLGCENNHVHSVTWELMSPRMHLSREQVRELVGVLQRWLDTGKLQAE